MPHYEAGMRWGNGKSMDLKIPSLGIIAKTQQETELFSFLQPINIDFIGKIFAH